MAKMGSFGERIGQRLRVTDAPTLITRSLRSAELAVAETRNDNPETGLSGAGPGEDSYGVSLKFRDYPDCESWESGRCIVRSDIRAGATYLYDLKRRPQYVINKPSHALFFHLPRSALDSIADQSGSPRIGELTYEPGVGNDDAIIRHLGAVLMEALRRPEEANQLFIDHTLLAFAAHVAQVYGGMRRATELVRGGLAPWQLKRACERLEADLNGTLPLRQIAAELDLSVSHFARAFRASVGMPPHKWLLQQRLHVAKELMTIRGLPLAEIAISAGFANQSHFTRVFSHLVGVSPAAWRRSRGKPGGET